MKFSAHTIEGKTTFCLVTFALMKRRLTKRTIEQV